MIPLPGMSPSIQDSRLQMMSSPGEDEQQHLLFVFGIGSVRPLNLAVRRRPWRSSIQDPSPLPSLSLHLRRADEHKNRCPNGTSVFTKCMQSDVWSTSIAPVHSFSFPPCERETLNELRHNVPHEVLRMLHACSRRPDVTD